MALKSYKPVLRSHPVQRRFDTVESSVLTELGVTTDDLDKMTDNFQGHIQLPGMPGYDNDKAGNPLYPESPKIIVYCAVPNDVRLALEWAHRYKWWVTCRSGGHSTAGFSLNNGMVIDVSLLNSVVVNPVLKQLTVGSGANWGQINSVLDTYQLHVTGGGCSTVGVAGYMQGGGYGFTARQFGMNSDNVTGVTVMLADGSIVMADESKNKDLFWAVRGGTGGNFGVLLEISYKLYDLYEVWGFGLKWNLEDAPAALYEIQTKFIKDNQGKNVNFQVVLGTVNDAKTSSQARALAMLGMYVGTREQGMAAIAPLINTIGSQLIKDETDTYMSLNDSLLDMLNPPDPSCIEFKHTGYIASPLSIDDWKQVVNFYATAPNKFDLLVLEPYGCAISEVPADKTAFIHRDPYMNFFADSFFDEAGKISSREVAQEWINDFVKVVTPFYNGHVYQNYPIRNFPDFRWAYWGDAFNTLLFIKNKYDHDNFFHFEQSISPYPADKTSLNISGKRSIFNNSEIIYERKTKH